LAPVQVVVFRLFRLVVIVAAVVIVLVVVVVVVVVFVQVNVHQNRVMNVDNPSFKSLSFDGSLEDWKKLDDEDEDKLETSSSSDSDDSDFDSSESSDDGPPAEDAFVTPRPPTEATGSQTSSQPALKVDMDDDELLSGNYYCYDDYYYYYFQRDRLRCVGAVGSQNTEQRN